MNTLTFYTHLTALHTQSEAHHRYSQTPDISLHGVTRADVADSFRLGRGVGEGGEGRGGEGSGGEGEYLM